MVPTAVLFCFWHGTTFWRHCTGSVQSSLWWKHNGKIIDKLSCVFNGSRTFAMFNRAWRKPPEKTRRCGDISFFFLCHILKKKKNRSVVVFLVICPEGKVTSLFWKDGPRCEALLGASVVSCRKRLQLIVRADCGNIQGHWVVRGVICSVLVWLPFLFFTAMRIVFVNAFFFSSFAADVFLSVQTEYIWNSCTFMPLLCRDVHVN